MGRVIPFPRRAERRYDPVALDRLVDELDRLRRPRELRRPPARQPRHLALVLAFPSPER